jgi:hypothetical protein
MDLPFAASVIGRHAGAQEGRRVRRRHFGGDGCQGALGGDHHFGVAAVVGNSGNRLILAVHAVTPPAGRAAAAMAAEEADPHSLAELPGRHALAEGINFADHFMARNAGVADVGSEALDGEGVRMTDAARLDPNADVPRPGHRQFPLHHFQAGGLGHLNGTIGCHCHRRLLRFEDALQR